MLVIRSWGILTNSYYYNRLHGSWKANRLLSFSSYLGISSQVFKFWSTVSPGMVHKKPLLSTLSTDCSANYLSLANVLKILSVRLINCLVWIKITILLFLIYHKTKVGKSQFRHRRKQPTFNWYNIKYSIICSNINLSWIYLLL